MIDTDNYKGKEVIATFQRDNFVHLIEGKFEDMQGGVYIFKDGTYNLLSNRLLHSLSSSSPNGNKDYARFDKFSELTIDPAEVGGLVSILIKKS